MYYDTKSIKELDEYYGVNIGIYKDFIQQVEDNCRKIQRAFNNHDIQLTLAECKEIYSTYSDEILCSDWDSYINDCSEENLFKLLQPWLVKIIQDKTNRFQTLTKQLQQTGHSEMKRKIIYPAIYKHFKNKYYATMGISQATNDFVVEDGDILYHVQHTELNKPIAIIKKNNGEYIHNEIEIKDALVLYKSLYDASGIYARPLEMFASEVDKEKYPNVKQKYRFELVKY